MMKKVLFLFSVLAMLSLMALAAVAIAETSYEGQIVKMEGLSTLYYVAADGKRYVFPNEQTYQTWFYDFSDIVTLSAEEIQAIPLSGNVRYRPGILLVKIQTNPKVYAVTKNGRLRWVKTEQLAHKLYGENWNLLVDDIPDSFFTNYTIDQDIDEESDYDAEEEVNSTNTIDGNRGLHLGHAKQANTTKCRAIPATPAVPGHKSGTGTTTPAIPAIPARECKIQAGDEETDTTAPIITAVAVTPGTTTASVTWTTDEESTSVVKYAQESLAIASSSEITIVADSEIVTDHWLEITGLIASSTYYYLVESADADSNIATTSEDTFTTTAE